MSAGGFRSGVSSNPFGGSRASPGRVAAGAGAVSSGFGSRGGAMTGDEMNRCSMN